MRYDFRNRAGEHWVKTSDGVVLSASDGCAWALRKKIGEVIAWFAAKKFKVYVTPENGGTKKMCQEEEA